MNTGAGKSHTGVGDILSHFLPHNVLRDARNLALAFQNEEVFRDYVVRRIWFVIPVVLVFVLVSTVCAAGVLLFLPRFTAPPVSLWFRAVVLLLVATIWLGGIVSQLYLFFVWLEQIALHRTRSAPARGAATRAITLAALAKGRVLAPWVFVAICVIFPLGILATRAPLVALVMFALGILAPVLYARLDP
jgi:hypothetical protein